MNIYLSISRFLDVAAPGYHFAICNPGLFISYHSYRSILDGCEKGGRAAFQGGGYDRKGRERRPQTHTDIVNPLRFSVASRADGHVQIPALDGSKCWLASDAHDELEIGWIWQPCSGCRTKQSGGKHALAAPFGSSILRSAKGTR